MTGREEQSYLDSLPTAEDFIHGDRAGGPAPGVANYVANNEVVVGTFEGPVVYDVDEYHTSTSPKPKENPIWRPR